MKALMRITPAAPRSSQGNHSTPALARFAARQLSLCCFAALALLVTTAQAEPGSAAAAPAGQAGRNLPPTSRVRDALASGYLGLYPANQFQLTTGECKNCAAPPQALWYFGKDILATPRQGAVGFDPHLRALDDIRAWSAATKGTPEGKHPGLLWLGSPQVAEGRLAPDGRSLLASPEAAALPFAVAPKIATNLSFFDTSSLAYFAAHDVKARGATQDGKFVARTLWPQDYALSSAPEAKPLRKGETFESLVRAEGGGAKSAFAARTLWQRDASQALALAGKPVLAFMLNGAQGDDDEAYGGHFAVATGQFGARGEWDSWLVNNFYNLGSVSEKGIIASTLPMDAYLGDVNSGQSWYRPSYMLVAILKEGRAPALFQEAIGRLFNHFYRQDFHYRHASMNCTGLNVETLRTLGWNVPRLGGENHLKAAVALPYMAAKDGSLASGQSAYDYLSTERTNLYPFVAFNTLGEDLLHRVSQGRQVGAGMEAQLAADLEAIVFVRIPQFPSSRAFGSAPVASLDEYMARAPKNHDDWKIIPVGPRPFPATLKDASAPEEAPPQSVLATYAWGATLAALAASLALFIVRRKKAIFVKGHAK